MPPRGLGIASLIGAKGGTARSAHARGSGDSRLSHQRGEQLAVHLCGLPSTSQGRFSVVEINTVIPNIIWKELGSSEQ